MTEQKKKGLYNIENLRDVLHGYGQERWSLKEAAMEYGTTMSRIRQILVENDVPIRDQGRPLGSEDLELRKRNRRIVAMRKHNLTLQEIGDLEGITRERVRQVLVEAGYTDTSHRSSDVDNAS